MNKINNIQEKVKKLPEGHLIVAKNGKWFKWYVSDGHKSTHIPKSNRSFAEKLALKEYLLLHKKHLEQEVYAIDQYLTFHNEHAEKDEHEFINSKRFKEFLSLNSPTVSEKINKWIHEDYERCNKYPDKLIHKTYSGNMVRSKSEAMIDLFLYQNQIPFRYECELILGNQILYPDFTIMHPLTGEVFYWEHLGMMDDPEYIRSALMKIKTYIEHGIVPGQNLILTFETRNKPLTLDTIERMVEVYLVK